jgi:hypothetical protein
MRTLSSAQAPPKPRSPASNAQRFDEEADNYSAIAIVAE